MTPDQIKRFYWVMFGEDMHEPNPPEIDIVKQTGDKITEKVIQLGPKVVRAIVEQTQQAGLPEEALQYVFWNLMERRSDWPKSLSEDEQEALLLALSLMSKSGSTPNYRSGLQVPPSDMESLVDVVVEGVAVWATGALAADILKIYSRETKRPGKKVDKMIRKRDQDLKGQGLWYLQNLIESGSVKFPRWFKDSNTLRDSLFVALGNPFRI